jgi:flavin reductase (DIM6/NTAB) family NADH-FMN oxidoreductase RutF
MDPAAKKHALRLVPYGLYLAGSRHADGHTAVSLVSWFTQTSFDPPLVVLGMHREGEAFKGVKETGVLAVSLLAATGCPLLPELPASLELRSREILELGDHATVVLEVVDAHVHHKDVAALDHKAAGLHYAG